MDNPVTMEIVEAIEQLPEQGFDGVLVNGEVKLLSMMPDNLIEVMLRVIEGKIEGHVGVVDVDVDELHDILVVDLPQKHDLSDGGGRDAVALLRLFELLDGDGGAAPASSLGMRWLEAREEDEAVGTLPDLSHKLVLLQPRGAIRPSGAAVPHRRRRPSTKSFSFFFSFFLSRGKQKWNTARLAQDRRISWVSGSSLRKEPAT